ncbi:MAG: SDR family oxidoreductase [Actinobacteria bacterium]|nr:SDR family oxidoreductase [Actinomycetota bacterium]
MTVHSIGSAPTPPASPGNRRVALVVGGAGGIGREVCAELLKNGLAVAIADIDPQRAAGVATELTSIGGDVIWVELNITEPSSVARAIGEVQQRLGPIDVMVNSAGWNSAAELLKSDEAYWRQMIDINLIAGIRITHAVLGGMIDRGYGRIVHIAGEAGRAGVANQSLMSAANGGLIAFVKAMAREVMDKGVTVNCLSPGPTATPMLDQLIQYAEDAAEMVASLRGAVPMGRLGQPADIAPVVAFLASEGAGFVTGQTISVSGGMTMT